MIRLDEEGALRMTTWRAGQMSFERRRRESHAAHPPLQETILQKNNERARYVVNQFMTLSSSGMTYFFSSQSSQASPDGAGVGSFVPRGIIRERADPATSWGTHIVSVAWEGRPGTFIRECGRRCCGWDCWRRGPQSAGNGQGHGLTTEVKSGQLYAFVDT